MLTPSDARCVGRESLLPDGQVCAQRQSCRRYLAILAHPSDEPHPWPVEMWLCRTERFERRLPVLLGEG